MRGARASMFANLAVATSSGCAFDSSGNGSGATSVGEGTEAGTSQGTSSPTGSGPEGGSADSGDSGPGCPPGGNGCPCDGESCADGLACANGTCVPASCGNGDVEANEECDDNNDKPDDGCEPDCTASVGAAQIATGSDHTCALTFDGRVRCWGEGDDGRTGQGAVADLGDNEPAQAGSDVPFDQPVKLIGLGDGFSCALLDNDHVACWGSNANGRLGLGSTEPAVLDTPGEAMTEVSLGAVVRSLAVGTAHACAVLDGGAVRCWGQGGEGRLGYGTNDTQDIGDNESPFDSANVLVGGQATSIAAGNEHTCVLLVSGDVRCWGSYDEGRLGVAAAVEDIGDDEHPDALAVLEFAGREVKAIFVGGDHSCAIVGDDDELWCWGVGTNGRLATGATEPLFYPAPIVTNARTRSVDIGSKHTCVLLDQVAWGEAMLDDVVRCFGEGMDGQLGAGGMVDLGDDAGELVDDLVPVDVVGERERRVLQLAAGETHSCARTSGGSVRCWGLADFGRLGYGNLEDIGDNETPATAGDVVFE